MTYRIVFGTSWNYVNIQPTIFYTPGHGYCLPTARGVSRLYGFKAVL